MFHKQHRLRQLFSIVSPLRQYSHSGNPDLYVFDRLAKRRQRELAICDPENEVCEYLKEEMGFRLADSVLDIKRKFNIAVDLGCGRGFVSRHITADMTDELVMCDSSHIILDQAVGPKDERVRVRKMVVDEEHIPFENNSIDLIVSCLALHWVNDLPGTFSRVISCLRNDGVFMGSVFGRDTLYELRSSLQLAELERRGGLSAHISPFTEVRDIGSLLTQAGFTMQTIHTDEMVIGYPSMFEVMWDLKGMGENNAAINRCQHLDREVMMAAATIYESMYGEEGKVSATFQLINFVAWKPDPSQPKPLPRGSAQFSLKDLEEFQKMVRETGHVDLNEKEKK